MRVITKTSTAKCTDELYISYLMSEPSYTSCTRLSEVMKTISHDSINRFLERERYEAKDLFEEEKNKIDLMGGILTVDDTVWDKPYSDPKKAAFIDYFWSGKHHQVVKGINLITLFYTDIHGVCVPVNYRLVDKSLDKSKHQYFQEMLLEILSWGIKPSWITGDSWYASLENLKFIRHQQINFLFGIQPNRIISAERGRYIQVQQFDDWQEDTLATVYLKDYGMVKLCRQIHKNADRYYVMSTAQLDRLEEVTPMDFERVHEAHWNIERFHRAAKQVCNIERFQVRTENSIKNHVFCALKAFVRLEFMRIDKKILHWYEVKRDLYLDVIRNFIIQHSQTYLSVNA